MLNENQQEQHCKPNDAQSASACNAMLLVTKGIVTTQYIVKQSFTCTGRTKFFQVPFLLVFS